MRGSAPPRGRTAREHPRVAPSAASAWEPAESGKRLDGAPAATCVNALAVGDGQLSAAIAARAGGAGGEVWLRYTRAAAGAAVVTRRLEPGHRRRGLRRLPGRRTPPVALATTRSACRRASASARRRGDEVDPRRRLGRSGRHRRDHPRRWFWGIQGVVTDEATGQPLDNRYVQLWDAAGSFVYATYTHNGTYLFALQPGAYFASTRSSSPTQACSTSSMTTCRVRADLPRAARRRPARRFRCRQP